VFLARFVPVVRVVSANLAGVVWLIVCVTALRLAHISRFKVLKKFIIPKDYQSAA